MPKYPVIRDIVTEVKPPEIYFLFNTMVLEDEMTTNVGAIDRVLRAALGLVLLYLAFASGLSLFASPLFKYGAAAVGIVMLLTSAMKLCPLYFLFGIKTCKAR